MGDTGAIADVLAVHDGVITVAQALACGLTRRQIQRRLATGAWKSVSSGVLRSAAHDYSEAAMVRAATAALGGVADRTTAAWWHGLLSSLPEPLTIAVHSAPTAARWTGGTVDAVRRKYHSSDVELIRGLPVTGLAMTVLGAAVELPSGSTLMDRALQAAPVTVRDLEAALERNAGLRGFVRARRLLRVVSGDTESEAERVFVRLLRAERITGWVPQYRVGPWRIDFAWPAEKVAVEINGWAFHHTPEQAERDHRKRNALTNAGWHALGYTWHQLTGDSGGCMYEIAQALAGRRAELL